MRLLWALWMAFASTSAIGAIVATLVALMLRASAVTIVASMAALFFVVMTAAFYLLAPGGK